MDVVYIHRGIAVSKGKTPDALLTFRNPSSRAKETKGVFILPSSPDIESINIARKRAVGWTERYTKNNPNLEPLVLSFKVTRNDFELLKNKFAIYYVGGPTGFKEEPLTRFDQLARETVEADKQGDPGITFNGEGLSDDIVRRLELQIGRREGKEAFVYKSFDEFSTRTEGSIVKHGEKNI
jgi:hypothetical protein